MKIGDMIYHRDDPTMQRGYGLVVKLYEAKAPKEVLEFVDVYWFAAGVPHM